MSSVTIFLIRTNSNARDDYIKISRKDNNILVQYTDRQGNGQSKQKILLTNTGLSRYIQNLGHMFLSDTEPFWKMQFNFPGFPSFMVTRKSLQVVDTQSAVMEVADIVSESWFADYPSGVTCGDCARDDEYDIHY